MNKSLNIPKLKSTLLRHFNEHFIFKPHCQLHQYMPIPPQSLHSNHCPASFLPTTKANKTHQLRSNYARLASFIQNRSSSEELQPSPTANHERDFEQASQPLIIGDKHDLLHLLKFIENLTSSRYFKLQQHARQLS